MLDVLYAFKVLLKIVNPLKLCYTDIVVFQLDHSRDTTGEIDSF